MIHQCITVTLVRTSSHPLVERALTDSICASDARGSTRLCSNAIIERLPYALAYAANLEPQDHAVLFYDNLVAAGEYFCAFIEEGIKRRELTCLTGLEPTLYRALFEQLGISVAELENCGYLRNFSTDNFYYEIERLYGTGSRGNSEDLLRTDMDCFPTGLPGIRLVHIQRPTNGQNTSLQDLMETERRVHSLSSFPVTSICCYDAKTVLDEVPANFFTQLLNTHDHCFFQGIALQTSRLLDIQRSAVYPKLKSA